MMEVVCTTMYAGFHCGHLFFINLKTNKNFAEPSCTQTCAFA